VWAVSPCDVSTGGRRWQVPDSTLSSRGSSYPLFVEDESRVVPGVRHTVSKGSSRTPHGDLMRLSLGRFSNPPQNGDLSRGKIGNP